jgi:hypothetical protein
MRVLSQSKLVEIVAGISESSLPAVLKRLGPLMPDGTPKDWATRDGYERCRVLEEGIEKLVIYYHLSGDGGLSINAAVSLVGENVTRLLSDVADKLAFEKKARYIIFTTRRLGLIKQSQLFGYFPESIVMRKIV